MATTRTRRSLATLSQVADYLGCDVRTVRRRVADGTFTAYRLPGRTRVIRLDLNEVDETLRPVPAVDRGAA